eukprot:1908651-Alexandrium_andersonii.AAC.1
MAHEVPSVPLAHDVWALLRDGAGPPRRMMDRTPLTAVVLIIAGSPCQDLTYAGATRGAVGAVLGCPRGGHGPPAPAAGRQCPGGG